MWLGLAMGKEVNAQSYTREERQRYREKVRANLDVFELMLTTSQFEFERPMTGLEIELNLVDDHYDPHFANAEVLQAIADPGYQTELGQYNIELNVPPRPLPGESALELEEELRASLNAADHKAQEVGSTIIAIGILPTIMPESACTSVQLHLQVEPATFAEHWNAAQAISAPQVALAANSPFFFGQRLHAETRIQLFTQATDTRPIELKNQGVRPRVFFGERWITSIFDLFEENVRYCGSRTGSCPPAPPLPTSWPTRPSTTARCGCSRPRTGLSGPR